MPLFSNPAQCWHNRGDREGHDMDEIWEWLQSLDPIFAFLVALPFLVAAVAFLGEFFRTQSRRNGHQQQHATKK